MTDSLKHHPGAEGKRPEQSNGMARMGSRI